MSSVNQKNAFRWVLLRHLGAPQDIRGIHFDLLIEDKEFCRSWRLSDIPYLDGPYVDAVYINPHKLYWLDIKEKVVSGNRGFATRIKKGIFYRSLRSNENRFLNLSLIWDGMEVILLIDQQGCRIISQKN